MGGADYAPGSLEKGWGSLLGHGQVWKLSTGYKPYKPYAHASLSFVFETVSYSCIQGEVA